MPSSKYPIDGYLYCLHNEVFDYYGKHMYKLGETHCIKKRLMSYSTSFPQPSKMICVSDHLSNKKLAQDILFYKLEKYRVNRKREFFMCDIDIIKKAFNEINNAFKNESCDELRKYIKINGGNAKKITEFARDERHKLRILALEKIEKIIGITRFNINDINKTEEEIEKIKQELLNSVNEIYKIYVGCQSKNKTVKRLTLRINKIKKNDQLQKFIAGCYNTFEDIVKFDVVRKRRKIGGHVFFERIYANFKINENTTTILKV